MSDSDSSASKPVSRAAALFGLIVAIIIVSVSAIVFAANELRPNGEFSPEIVLPLVVIVGVVALLATLALTAATFGLFKISDKHQALGLPAGSIQAVIALSLILIFAVVALYASGDTGSQQLESKGLTAAEYQAIPSAQVVTTIRREEQGEVRYDVVRSVEDTAAKDINTQLLTTVSTLVVAVAGFYFGSKSAQEGSSSALKAAAPNRTLEITKPSSPQEVDPSSGPLKITLQSVPPGAQLNWLREGPGRLSRQEDGTFIYDFGNAEPDESATLHFEQVDDPKAADTLVVNFSDPSKRAEQIDEEAKEA